MHTFLIVTHMLTAMTLVALVLLQHGKGADAGAAFGSGASSTVFGSRGSGSFITRATAVLAAVFFLTSLSLGYLSKQQVNVSKSVVENIQPAAVTDTGGMPADSKELPAEGIPEVPGEPARRTPVAPDIPVVPQ